MITEKEIITEKSKKISAIEHWKRKLGERERKVKERERR